MACSTSLAGRPVWTAGTRNHGVKRGGGGGDLDPGQLVPAGDQDRELASAHVDHRHGVTDQHLALVQGREHVDRLPGLDRRRVW